LTLILANQCIGKMQHRVRAQPIESGGDMRVGIAADHGGFGLKEELVAQLRAGGHEVVDFGAHSANSLDDYPDFVVPLAAAVSDGNVERPYCNLR
jgi:hypothetical protein